MAFFAPYFFSVVENNKLLQVINLLLIATFLIILDALLKSLTKVENVKSQVRKELNKYWESPIDSANLNLFSSYKKTKINMPNIAKFLVIFLIADIIFIILINLLAYLFT